MLQDDEDKVGTLIALIWSEPPIAGTPAHANWVQAVDAFVETMSNDEVEAANRAIVARREADKAATKQARSAIGKKRRFEVFKRDGFVCAYCGAHPPQVVLEVDHIRPVADGGGNEETNLITACFNCNRGKGAGQLSDVPKSLSERASEVAEREEQVAGYEAIMRAYRDRLDQNTYEILDRLCDHHKRDGIPKSDFQSIRRFIEKLGLHEVAEACEIAIARKSFSYQGCFRYFCGVCWKKIRESEGR